MKKTLIIFYFIILPGLIRAETLPAPTTEITMTPVEVMQSAGALVDRGDFETAEQLLTMTPKLGNTALELERWFLLAQISSRRDDFDTAIKIYRKILDDQPDLARVRFELAICYIKTKQWARADYQMRLAMAGNDLSDDVKKMMSYYRYVIRKNKNWNVWFNFGAAPDTNINTATGGEECVMTIFGLFCNELSEPESVIGSNFQLGGNYEFKISNQWRIKSYANIYANIYNKSDYDDFYLSAGTGPRFVWEKGDVWLAATAGKRWYGWDEYNWSYGARLETNYDWSRRFSSGLALGMTNNTYDELGEYLDGQSYSTSLRNTYSFNASQYMTLRISIDRDITIQDAYSNWRPGLAIGYGAEIPFGFRVYIEPSVYLTSYDAARWVVGDNTFAQITERSWTQKYSISLSNNKISVWDFVPVITASYTRRDSNIWQREYDKFSFGLSMQQRF